MHVRRFSRVVLGYCGILLPFNLILLEIYQIEKGILTMEMQEMIDKFKRSISQSKYNFMLYTEDSNPELFQAYQDLRRSGMFNSYIINNSEEKEGLPISEDFYCQGIRFGRVESVTESNAKVLKSAGYDVETAFKRFKEAEDAGKNIYTDVNLADLEAGLADFNDVATDLSDVATDLYLSKPLKNSKDTLYAYLDFDEIVKTCDDEIEFLQSFEPEIIENDGKEFVGLSLMAKNSNSKVNITNAFDGGMLELDGQMALPLTPQEFQVLLQLTNKDNPELGLNAECTILGNGWQDYAPHFTMLNSIYISQNRIEDGVSAVWSSAEY